MIHTPRYCKDEPTYIQLALQYKRCKPFNGEYLYEKINEDYFKCDSGISPNDSTIEQEMDVSPRPS